MKGWFQPGVLLFASQKRSGTNYLKGQRGGSAGQAIASRDKVLRKRLVSIHGYSLPTRVASGPVEYTTTQNNQQTKRKHELILHLDHSLCCSMKPNEQANMYRPPVVLLFVPLGKPSAETP